MKFEGIIRAIAKLAAEGRTETAKHHLNRALKHYDEMSDIEKEVIDVQRIDLYEIRKGCIDSEAAAYWENRILAAQEM